MSDDGDKRPWLAALLAVVYPGMGHLYLGLWGKALLWSGLAAVSAAVFVRDDAVAIAREQGLASLGGALSTTTLVVLVTVTAMAAFDAYWLATRGAAAQEGRTCPECGKPVEEDLSFCQWCSADLESVSAR